MEVSRLLNERAAQEADVRLRRRSLAAERAAQRAAALEALETEQINTLQAQMNKWTSIGVNNANLHDLKDPVIVPTGSRLFITFCLFSRLVSRPDALADPSIFRGDFGPKTYQTQWKST
jgi:CHAD domain-containing protein